MANSSTVSSSVPSREYYCKVCDLSLDTLDSLEVHLQYHKENLYVKWGAQGHHDAENNNAKVKSETTVSAPADSSDAMITMPSAEYQQRATPETSGPFPHPATPQSYHSAPSPYQNPDQTNYSPGPQFGTSQFSHSSFPANQHPEQLNWEQSQYGQEQQFHKPGRFHPYGVQERTAQVSSSSPLYGQPLNQPTPSPSPNQCDKCGFVCDSAVQLSEHCSSAHAGAAPAPAPASFQQFTPKYNQNFQSENNSKIKEEHEESSDILDLDSQKVVYQGNEGEQPNPPYDQTTTAGREVNSRTVPMMPWEAQKLYANPQINGDVSLFKDQKLFAEQKAFHVDQKFTYAQEKFLSVHHDQKPFMHGEQKMFGGVQMPPLTDYAGSAGAAPDMKPPYRPYDSPAPQITSTQPANSTSAALPSMGGKGANWKSNEARRPKTYNCTACNKWFTSSGHLKRHYNTTLHKNAVRSSGQPDPATMPISAHHHPSRDALAARAQQQQQQPPDSNTQSPAPAEERDDLPYAAQGFERSHRAVAAAAAMQAKSPYSHLQQGNIDNNFMSNNPLANHPLPHQVGSHPLNIGSQPPGIGNINDSSPNSKGAAISSSGNPPNGEAGPSVTQNHHLRGLLSVSTSNITTPALTQSTAALTHTLPPFSHLAVNPYSPRSTDPLAPSVPDPTHTPLYLGQNFQQTIAPNYPNGMAPHVMDMAISNLHIASLATFGESVPEEVTMECETSNDSANGRLPSFAQLQTRSFGIYVPNYLPSPNVGGHEDAAAGYIVIDPCSSLPYGSVDYHPQKVELDYYAPRLRDDDDQAIDAFPAADALALRTIKREEDGPHSDSSDMQTYNVRIKIEDVMDYANKENYETAMKSPASPESAKTGEYESGGSPSISSTVPSTPLLENNHQLAKAAGVHKCFECDKVFNKACYLTQHNKTFHSGFKPFKCTRCGKRFSDDVSYEEHFSKHAENKPFKCAQCPKSFNHKTDLRRHMCLHSGTKPFPCHHCGKGFIRKDHMLKHCETHRKNVRTRRLLSAGPSDGDATTHTYQPEYQQ